MTPDVRRRSTHRRRAAATAAVLALLLTACSASSGDASLSSEDAQGAGADGGAQLVEEGTATGDAELALGSTTTQVSDAAANRQVITRGEVQATASDPRAAADAIVAVVERDGGRVDSRVERAGTADQDAHATITVRVPSDDMTTTLDAVEDVGDVVRVDLTSEDVTGDVQDLDARIRAMQLSVARMEDLLARATTNADVISAEGAVAERQAELESMQTRRARIAEDVALSTLVIDISIPTELPVVVEATAGPGGFLGGLAAGWGTLVAVLGGLLVVLGALLPWVVFGGLVAAGALVATRLARRRRSRVEAS
ncbi:DUF4349 domain-containing protein [Cellulomonas sp. P22]|uniref:DUF4349 domain-containing protein n=1 Tax=Cellulomonas sp. P22 TaxID=3373189 RepID=UPI0037983C19